MSELLVAGFADAHSAFLACATLSRLQTEIDLGGQDVAVMTRGENGEVTVREAVDLNGQKAMHEAFWKTLVSLLFFPLSADPATDARPTLDRLAAIGVDERFIRDVRQLVMPGNSAALVIVEEANRDQVLGLLRGFGAKTKRCRLIGKDQEQWQAQLSSDPDQEGKAEAGNP